MFAAHLRLSCLQGAIRGCEPGIYELLRCDPSGCSCSRAFKMRGLRKDITMKRLRLIHVGLVFTLLSAVSNMCGQDSAFTYEGRLTDGSNPATGFYDLRFVL